MTLRRRSKRPKSLKERFSEERERLREEVRLGGATGGQSSRRRNPSSGCYGQRQEEDYQRDAADRVRSGPGCPIKSSPAAICRQMPPDVGLPHTASCLRAPN